MHLQQVLGVLAVISLQWMSIYSPLATNFTFKGYASIKPPMDELGATLFECFDKAPEYFAIDYDDCQRSIDAFKREYPPANKKADWYTLNHHRPAERPLPNIIHCPLNTNPIPSLPSCDFIFDYTSYPFDRSIRDDLRDVADYGEMLIRECKRQKRYDGGHLRATFGSWVYKLTLQAYRDDRVAIAYNTTL